VSRRRKEAEENMKISRVKEQEEVGSRRKMKMS